MDSVVRRTYVVDCNAHRDLPSLQKASYIECTKPVANQIMSTPSTWKRPQYCTIYVIEYLNGIREQLARPKNVAMMFGIGTGLDIKT